eukprot:8058587-Pyramimonas_sp.AAC.1
MGSKSARSEKARPSDLSSGRRSSEVVALDASRADGGPERGTCSPMHPRVLDVVVSGVAPWEVHVEVRREDTEMLG